MSSDSTAEYRRREDEDEDQKKMADYIRQRFALERNQYNHGLYEKLMNSAGDSRMAGLSGA